MRGSILLALAAAGLALSVPGLNQEELQIRALSPTNGTNRLALTLLHATATVYECYLSTNLAAWALSTTNLVPDPASNRVDWLHETPLFQGFFRAGNAVLDTDEDGLPDAREYVVYGTDPSRADTDGDDMPDPWEVAFGLDPLDPADRAFDADADGLNNLAECRLGCNPVKPLVPDPGGFVNLQVYTLLE